VFEANEILIINFARRLTHVGPVTVIRVPLASSVTWLVTQIAGMNVGPM
jgi:hypothetical protein